MGARARAHAELLWCGSFVFSPAKMRAVASPLVGPLLYSKEIFGRPPLSRRRVRAARRAFSIAGFMIPAGNELAKVPAGPGLNIPRLAPAAERNKYKLSLRTLHWLRHSYDANLLEATTIIDSKCRLRTVLVSPRTSR